MLESEKLICDDILRYGEILSDNEFQDGNDFVRQYEIRYESECYLMTKLNGEWIYFIRRLGTYRKEGNR